LRKKKKGIYEAPTVLKRDRGSQSDDERAPEPGFPEREPSFARTERGTGKTFKSPILQRGEKEGKSSTKNAMHNVR